MKVLNLIQKASLYAIGFLTGVVRVTTSIVLLVFEAPMACHYLGAVSAKLKVFPQELTDEELHQAFKDHLGE